MGCRCDACSECCVREVELGNQERERADKAEAELAKLRSAAFSVRSWFAGPNCNDCEPEGKFGAGGWEGKGPRDDGHESACAYARDIDKLSALIDPWQAELYAKRCKCENSECSHHGDSTIGGARSCPNQAGEKKITAVGKVCNICYNNIPEKYRVET